MKKKNQKKTFFPSGNFYVTIYVNLKPTLKIFYAELSESVEKSTKIFLENSVLVVITGCRTTQAIKKWTT